MLAQAAEVDAASITHCSDPSYTPASHHAPQRHRAGNWAEDRSRQPPLKGGLPDFGFVSTDSKKGETHNADQLARFSQRIAHGRSRHVPSISEGLAWIGCYAWQHRCLAVPP
jgi:hypothetical protein